MNSPSDNGLIAVQIEDARHCLADLAQRGCRVRNVEIGILPVPRITIHRPPARARLQGGVMRIINHGGKREQTFAANHKDCQVEWRETL